MAELRKRGDDFWGEFEFYLSDLMVGLVLDVVLVTLIAPAIKANQTSIDVGGAYFYGTPPTMAEGAGWCMRSFRRG